MAVNRHLIENAIEEWREQYGVDFGDAPVLYEPEAVKDLARHLLMRVREAQ